MKLHLAAVGKPRREWVRKALTHYTKFLAKYGGVDFHFIPETRITKKSNPDRIRQKETQALLDVLPDRAVHIFLDQSGKQLDSIAFANKLAKTVQDAVGPVGFLLGGPSGLDLAQRRTGDHVWALSQLTLPHELALIIACEQLARALSILRGDAYHR